MTAGRLKSLLTADLMVAVAFVVAAIVEGVLRHRGEPKLMLASIPAGTILFCVALRRSRPLLAIAIFAAGAAVGTLVESALGTGSLNSTVPILAMVLLCYSLGAYGNRLELALGCPLPVLLVLIIDLTQPSGYWIPGALAFFAVFVVGAPVLAGRLVRARRSMVERLRDQERTLESERALRAAEAVAVERAGLTEHLRESLVVGIESIIQHARQAIAMAMATEPEAVAAIESAARSLLGTTRAVIVTLASPPPPGVAGEPPPPAAAPVAAAPATIARDDVIAPLMAIAGAAVTVGLALGSLAARRPGVPVAGVLLGSAAIGVPLMVAWSRPLAMIVIVWTAAAVYSLLAVPLVSVFAAIALLFLPAFVVAALAGRRQSLIGLGLCCVGAASAFGLTEAATDLPLVAGSFAAGWILADWIRLERRLRANNRVIEHQREAHLRRAVLEERARLAGEVHDSIGHALTVIALQAGAARRLWASDRARARSALETIVTVASTALAELQLAVPKADTRGLEDLTQLLEGARAAGLTVELRLDGESRPLPQETELAAYRVTQEALTNILKHAPGAVAQLTVRRAAAELELVIANAGGRPGHAAGGGGHGLPGMRRRVEGVGGRLTWGPRRDGGYEVRARFPVPVSV